MDIYHEPVSFHCALKNILCKRIHRECLEAKVSVSPFSPLSDGYLQPPKKTKVKTLINHSISYIAQM